MPTFKQHSISRNWLIGIPKKRASLWWRFFFWPQAMGGKSVPEQLQSSGMFCPICRKGQPFSDRCTFCGCAFSCFVVLKSGPLPSNKQHSTRTVPPVRAKPGGFHRFSTTLRLFFIQLSNVPLRFRVISLCVTLLLLITLIVGVVKYRSHLLKSYAQKYVTALYGINSGMNLNGLVCEGKYKGWKENSSFDESASSTVDAQTIADLKGVKAYVDETREEMGAPPAELEQAARTLQKLYDIYEKMYSRITDSPDSLSLHNSEIGAARENFSMAIENLKTSLPVSLAKEITKAGQKYDLNFMH